MPTPKGGLSTLMAQRMASDWHFPVAMESDMESDVGADILKHLLTYLLT